MLRGMTARQLEEWMVFARLEPFEPERLESVIGSVRQVLINVNRKRGASAKSIDDCTPKFGDTVQIKPKQDWHVMYRIAQTLTAESRRTGGRR